MTEDWIVIVVLLTGTCRMLVNQRVPLPSYHYHPWPYGPCLIRVVVVVVVVVAVVTT